MLPLSTIEGQETEEVQTKPPEKGGETHMGWKTVCRWQWGGGLQGMADGEVLTLKTDPNPKYLPLAPLGEGGP